MAAGTWVKEWRRINGLETAPTHEELLQVMQPWLRNSGNPCPRLQALRGGGSQHSDLRGLLKVARAKKGAGAAHDQDVGASRPALVAWRSFRGGFDPNLQDALLLPPEPENPVQADSDDLVRDIHAAVPSGREALVPSLAPGPDRRTPGAKGSEGEPDRGGAQGVGPRLWDEGVNDDVRVMGARLCQLRLHARNRSQAVGILRHVLGMQVSHVSRAVTVPFSCAFSSSSFPHFLVLDACCQNPNSTPRVGLTCQRRALEMPTAWGIRNPQVIRHEEMDQGHSTFAQETEQRAWSKTVLAYGPEQRGVSARTICEGAGGCIV